MRIQNKALALDFALFPETKGDVVVLSEKHAHALRKPGLCFDGSLVFGVAIVYDGVVDGVFVSGLECARYVNHVFITNSYTTCTLIYITILISLYFIDWSAVQQKSNTILYHTLYIKILANECLTSTPSLTSGARSRRVG